MNSTTRFFVEWALRLSLGITFLTSVSSRFSFLRGGEDAWERFVTLTGQFLSFMPTSSISTFAVLATIAETTFGILLLFPVGTKWIARGAALLLLSFALSMTISFGIAAPLSRSVFTAAAAAFALSVIVSQKK